MNLSVYPQRCQALEQVFNEAGDPTQLLIVPVDTAKRIHVGRICDGRGSYVYKQPFNVNNTVTGVKFLEKQVEKARRKTKVPRSRTIVAMEDPPPYAINFAHRLADLDYLVVRVNARDASRKRKSVRGSSDVSALDGICRMVMDRQAYELGPECGPFAQMRLAATERRRLVRMETALKNMVHRNVEIVFPGFCDIPGIQLFGPPAMRLMTDNFHAGRIARMRPQTLENKLKNYGESRAEEVAKAIVSVAKDSVKCNGMTAEHAFVLKQHVQTLEGIRASLRLQTTAMGTALAKTDGAYLTTIPGIGVVLAGQIVAELGMRGLYGAVSLTASYAGIVPNDHQTGGPNSPVVHGHLPKDRNSRLKDYLLQASHHVGKTMLPNDPQIPGDRLHDLMVYYHNKDARGEKSRLGTARKLLRTMRCMAKEKAIYQPPVYFANHQEQPNFVPLYLESMLAALRRKWKTAGVSIEDDNELGTIFKTFSDLADQYRRGRITTLED